MFSTLDNVNNIYAIGAGKATYPLAVALEEILGDRITDGFIAIKKGQQSPLSDMLGTLSKYVSPNQPTPYRMKPA
jgi:glycerate-2-kinase